MDKRLSDAECPGCGMAYDKETPTDRRAHRIYHDAVINGVPGRPLKTERVIWRKEDQRIILVTPRSPKAERVRARNVARLANREVHHLGGIYSENEPLDSSNLHLFLYGVRDRLMALTIFELRDRVCRVRWEEYDRREAKELELAPPVWSVGFAWVHLAYRRQGIARRLFMEGTRFLNISLDVVGVYTPFSGEGEKLARALFPTGFLVAK